MAGFKKTLGKRIVPKINIDIQEETAPNDTDSHNKIMPLESYNCGQCPYESNLPPQMKNPIISNILPKCEFFNCANPIESLKCVRCISLETYSSVNLRQHLESGHKMLLLKKKRHICKNCSFNTHSRFLYVKHKLCHLRSREKNQEKQRKDKTESEFEGTSKLVVNAKIRRRYGNQLHKCEHCPYTSKRKDSLKCHIMIKHTSPGKIEWFNCEHCPYKSKTKFNLKKHVYCKHDTEKYLKCDHCPYETKFKNSMDNHLVTKHTDLVDVKWFSCEKCTFKSRNKYNVKKHMDNKHGVIEYAKCDYCPFQTKSKYWLKSHVLVKHTEVEKAQWFECGQCSYKSKNKYNVKYHTDRKHVSAKKCEHCPFETTSKRTMKNHVVLKHTDLENVEWFYCEHCPYKARIKMYVQSHITRHHSDLGKGN